MRRPTRRCSPAPAAADRGDARSSACGGRTRSRPASTSLTAPPTERICTIGASLERDQRLSRRGLRRDVVEQAAADAAALAAHVHAAARRRRSPRRARVRLWSSSGPISSSGVNARAAATCRHRRRRVQLRDRPLPRLRNDVEEAGELARRVLDERAPALSSAALGLEDHRREDDVADLVGLELERGDDAEVPPAPRTAQNRSGCCRRRRERSRRRARARRPTTWSIVRPCRRAR